MYGAVAADDPQAALIGRDILTAGGNAVDAAVAMYFSMSVTLPSAASLGGGGICLVFSPTQRKVEVLDFLARPPQVIPRSADRPTAIPGNVRGFFALHARYGRARWAELLTPAETLARFGTPISRALANDIKPVQEGLSADAEVRRVFAGPDGRTLLGEGETLVQLDLASVIARLRAEGPGIFYSGQVASKLLEGVRLIGGSLERTDLSTYVPEWRAPLVVTGGGRAAFYPPPPPAAGAIQGEMWAMLSLDDRYADAAADGRTRLLVDSALRAFADWDRRNFDKLGDPQALLSGRRITARLTDSLPARGASAGDATSSGARLANPSAASLMAVDGEGAAVGCAVTLNSLFGTGRMAEGTGIILAALPGPGGRGASMLGPMLVTDAGGRHFYYVSAASGGIAAPSALIEVAARTLLAEEPLAYAVAQARVITPLDSDRVIVEDRMSAAAIADLRQHGYAVGITPTLGRVDAIFCTEGLPDGSKGCDAVSDPRGYGLALTTN